jgi:hypothetical protein
MKNKSFYLRIPVYRTRPIRLYHWLGIPAGLVAALMGLCYLVNGGQIGEGVLWLLAGLAALGWCLHRTGLIHGRDSCPKLFDWRE